MQEALIQTLSVQLGSDRRTVEVVAEVMEGHITIGMNVEIELNRSLSVSVPVIGIMELDGNQVKLMLDGGANEGANNLEGLNFAGETLLVTSQVGS